MTIYQQILSWSQARPFFIRDALRRLVTLTNLAQNDIDELVQLLKKDCGDTSITLSAVPLENIHIPTAPTANGIYPKLISISNPINICALHNEGHLQFSNSGLTVVYGNNGSGKSSYSRILRKLCWSRNPSIELKKNVFYPSPDRQQVDFVIENNNSSINFTWTENSPPDPILNSIFVFDNDCGDVYINKENPTEYKPIGIDVLEKLVLILGNISQILTLEIAPYNTQKPTLDPTLTQTQTAKWYGNIENLQRADIDLCIQFSQINVDRKQELINLTSAQNPQQNITNLDNKRRRISNYIQQLSQIESLFTTQSVKETQKNRCDFERINQAYQIATNELSSVNTLEGFGTSPWRTLWEAARSFAHSCNMSDGQNFPSLASLEQCVLCQQKLDETAQRRLIGFNQFVLNDVSTQLNSAISIIQQKQNIYNTINIPPFENIAELEYLIPDFRNTYDNFCNSIVENKNLIISYLQNGGEINVNLQTITPIISMLIQNIDSQIVQNNELLQNRNALLAELNELKAKEFLYTNKTAILQYYDELRFKSWIGTCQAKLNTRPISLKIGELMEDQAVSLQHQEFISHLGFFNSDLATKVSISKTRTTQGNTFQKCNLDGLNETISSVLSEGEQKIIALSNFLAECTIDGRLNSIIFDDPVNSLDIDYRDKIANKIVHLSRNRQVIILTHDLYFLRLLMDIHKSVTQNDCLVIGIDKYDGISGIVTDEIPYLVKNVQERIDSIKRILNEHDTIALTDAHGRETKLDSAQKRFRMLLERSVEEILSNRTYERFSKNIHMKKGNLSSYIITEQSDVDFLLNLFGKYSITEHDGGASTIPQLPNRTELGQDIVSFSSWKDAFISKRKAFQTANAYN